MRRKVKILFLGFMITAILVGCFAIAKPNRVYAVEVNPYEEKIPFYLSERKDDIVQYWEGRETISASCIVNGGQNAETLILEEGIQEISSDTFAGKNVLRKVYIPASVTNIAADAFGEKGTTEYIADSVVIYAEEGSCAHQYAVENGIQVEIDKEFFLYDEKSGLAVVLTEDDKNVEKGTKLQVDIISEGARFEELIEGFTEQGILYDISLLYNGEQVAVEGNVRVYFQVPYTTINARYGSFYTVNPQNELSEMTLTGKYEEKMYEAGLLEDILMVSGHIDGDASNDFVIKDGVLESFRCWDTLIVVPEGVSVIGEYALHNEAKVPAKVTKILLPEGVTTIEKNAFYRNGLRSVVMPDSIKEIDENAFEYTVSVEPFQGEIVNCDDYPVIIYGKTLTVAESYATEHGDTFVPTNDQLRGDVNGNGIFEAEDALGILKMVVKLETMYGYSADANEDGEVAADDALKVLRKVVELE